jgi:hypothetical protein
MDKNIMNYVEQHNMNIVPHFSRDQYKKGCKDKQPKYYLISSEFGEVASVIYPDCTYEKFLERMLSGAIEEAERLTLIIHEMEKDYDLLCDDYTALKEEFGVE